MRRLGEAPNIVAYVAFTLIGMSAGVNGVLLVAQISDYAVDQATIGLTFFTGSLGFVLAGSSAGPLVHRFGFRIMLAAGGGGFVLAGLCAAARPPFMLFVILQVFVGYATGMLETVLNAYLTTRPNSPALLNRLHAFFGVGALIGPPLATWIVGRASWTVVWLVLALAYVPVVAGFLAVYPRSRPEADKPQADEPVSGGLLLPALRQRGIMLGAALLAVYVGLEIAVGNWGFSYLTQERAQSELLAGYTVSAYWFGLTAGRFLISPAATRLGVTVAGTLYACLGGVACAAALAWALPAAAAASVGFALLGFFLGPIFPSTMAMAPELTTARLVPTAIGVMNAGSVVGGSALPWLAGAMGQRAGMWILPPFAVVLALVQLGLLRAMALPARTEHFGALKETTEH